MPGGLVWTTASNRRRSESTASSESVGHQVSRGSFVKPSHWGITQKQCKELLAKLRADPAWKREHNVYTLVQDYIKPWTLGTGKGYALFLNDGEEKEINTMISHAWNENAEEFLESVVRSCNVEDVMFICAFSLYQCEDGQGPSIQAQLGSKAEDSPFFQVLQHIRAQGERCGWLWRWHSVLMRVPGLFLLLAATAFLAPAIRHGCVPSFQHCSVRVQHDAEILWVDYAWTSPRQGDVNLQRLLEQCPGQDHAGNLVELPGFVRHALPLALALLLCSVASMLLYRRLHCYRGRMVVCPNHVSDLYARLWCVYEIFIARSMEVPIKLAYTLASAGQCRAKDATCFSQADFTKIRGHIEEYGEGDKGYEMIDASIQHTTFKVYLFFAWLLLARVWMLSLVNMAFWSFWDTFHAKSPCFLAKLALGDEQQMALSEIPAFVANVIDFVLVFLVVKGPQGKPSGRRALGMLATVTLLGTAVFVCRYIVDENSFMGRLLRVLQGFVVRTIAYAMLFYIILLLTSVSFGRFRRFRRLALAGIAISLYFLAIAIGLFLFGGTVIGQVKELYSELVFLALLSAYVVTPVMLQWEFVQRMGIRVQDC